MILKEVICDSEEDFVAIEELERADARLDNASAADEYDIARKQYNIALRNCKERSLLPSDY